MPRRSYEEDIPLQLGDVVARAGEGTIYQVDDHPDWVAKIFHATLSDLPTKLAKVEAMALSPPPGAVQRDGFVVLTWPMHAVELDDGTAGYIMYRVDTATSVEIHAISNPSNRANPLLNAPQWPRHATWEHLVNVAANLCLAVDTVHHVDAVIGDFQERNILVSDTTRVTLVDCDSMQFTDADDRRYLCGVGRSEFTAPELAGVNLRTHPREKPSDLFALAVHVHLLLMAGNHPFMRGIWTGAGEQPDAFSLAKAGHWAGGPQSPLQTHPLAPPPSYLPATIQHLFVRAFTDGAGNPDARPKAAEWRHALGQIKVTPCGRNAHQIPIATKKCPWCAIDDHRKSRKHKSARSATATSASTRRHPAARKSSPTTSSTNRWRAAAWIIVACLIVTGALVAIFSVARHSADSRAAARQQPNGLPSNAVDCPGVDASAQYLHVAHNGTASCTFAKAVRMEAAQATHLPVTISVVDPDNQQASSMDCSLQADAVWCKGTADDQRTIYLY